MRHKSNNKTRPLFTLSLEMTRLVNETRLLLVPCFNLDIYGIQSNHGYPNSFVFGVLYCVWISDIIQIPEVVAKISRKIPIQQFITFQLLLNNSLVFVAPSCHTCNMLPHLYSERIFVVSHICGNKHIDKSHNAIQQNKKQQNTSTASLNFHTFCSI